MAGKQVSCFNIKNKRICIVTGTRAEYSLLKLIYDRLQHVDEVDTFFAVTGTHLSDFFGKTLDEIKKDGVIYCEVHIPTDDDTKYGMADATGESVKSFASFFRDNYPDVVLVLGDRFEILGAVIAAYMQGIPVAHISGGDVTEGAVDDAIRHCITKMSILHFPGCEDSARRIVQMGEDPTRVHNVGELGVENCLNMKFASREELVASTDCSLFTKKYAVVTYHPVTMENDTAEGQVRELIRAMDERGDLAYIVTLANADAGGRLINELWEREAVGHPNWLVVPSLGGYRYLSAVSHAELVIGNSSSGLIEAPALHVPTINIGDRQKGRLAAESVITCSPICYDIVCAIDKGRSLEFRESVDYSKLPFGDGHTSEKIVDVLLDYLSNDELVIQKKFYDLTI